MYKNFLILASLAVVASMLGCGSSSSLQCTTCGEPASKYTRSMVVDPDPYKGTPGGEIIGVTRFALCSGHAGIETNRTRIMNDKNDDVTYVWKSTE